MLVTRNSKLLITPLYIIDKNTEQMLSYKSKLKT